MRRASLADSLLVHDRGTLERGEGLVHTEGNGVDDLAILLGVVTAQYGLCAIRIGQCISEFLCL